jgi:hypothetical protein
MENKKLTIYPKELLRVYYDNFTREELISEVIAVKSCCNEIAVAMANAKIEVARDQETLYQNKIKELENYKANFKAEFSLKIENAFIEGKVNELVAIHDQVQTFSGVGNYFRWSWSPELAAIRYHFGHIKSNIQSLKNKHTKCR